MDVACGLLLVLALLLLLFVVRATLNYDMKMSHVSLNRFQFICSGKNLIEILAYCQSVAHLVASLPVL